MFKGFYNLTSGMLTQGKNLDVIANNMTNTATAGFKADTFVGQTFEEVVYSRVGNKDKTYTEIGKQSYATVPSEVYTDFTQGGFDQTNQPLDFAIDGDGYFAIETEDGKAYTRSGSFCLDDEGYLYLTGQGRVLDVSGQPIALITDDISADSTGKLYAEDGSLLGQIGVFSFGEDAELAKNEHGLFETDSAAQASTATIRNGMIERSNVDLVEQMTNMMSSQRAYQSAAQALKIYDGIMSKATEQVGRI
ncbi:MAG: flagellar hook-basal body protein [Clostridia bacterium]|nr:flagellar hook-basal body protein [Clostridia bacterium]